MDPIFEAFRKAYNDGDGYALSMTLSPVDPASEPDRLYNFFRSTNYAQVQRDFQYRILHDTASPFKLPVEEGNGWVEVYHAFWKAVGEILKAEDAEKNDEKVRSHYVLQVLSLTVLYGLLPLSWKSNQIHIT